MDLPRHQTHCNPYTMHKGHEKVDNDCPFCCPFVSCRTAPDRLSYRATTQGHHALVVLGENAGAREWCQ
jgi:hypothetical protein